MKTSAFIWLFICNLLVAQNTPPLDKLFRVFKAYDTAYMKVEYDTLLIPISDIEEVQLAGLKKILVAEAKTKDKILPSRFIKKKYGRLLKSMGGHIIKDFEAAAIYEIVLQDTQHLFFTEIYNDGADYSLTLLKTNHYKLNPQDIYNEISASGNISLYINFGTNKTHIPAEAEEVINSILQFMTQWENIKLSIEGHTDNVGTPEENMRLSIERANTVMLSLITNGISATRLKAKGWGETKPKADNKTEASRQQNRRVELVRIK